MKKFEFKQCFIGSSFLFDKNSPEIQLIKDGWQRYFNWVNDENIIFEMRKYKKKLNEEGYYPLEFKYFLTENGVTKEIKILHQTCPAEIEIHGQKFAGGYGLIEYEEKNTI